MRELLNKTPEEVVDTFDNLTLFYQKGDNSDKSVLISALLHADEPCGLEAFLEHINNKDFVPQKDIYFLLGNSRAGRKKEKYFSQRLNKGGENFNRIWKKNPETLIQYLAKEILNTLPSNLSAHIDLHSFSAKNLQPHTYLSNKTQKSYDFAGRLTKIVLKGKDENLLIDRTSEFTNSLLVECGTNGSKEAKDFAYQSIEDFFNYFEVLSKKKDLPIKLEAFFENETNIKLLTNDFSFGREPNQTKYTLRDEIETLNLKKIHAGRIFAYGEDLNLFSKEIADKYFIQNGGNIYFKKNCTINLFSQNSEKLQESGFYIYD